MKKMKKWVALIGTKNLIAIAALLILVVAVGVGVAVSNNKGNQEADSDIQKENENVGLKVEENAEGAQGDSIDFDEFFSEDDKTDTDNDGIVDKKDDDDDNDGVVDAKDDDDNNDGVLDVEDSKHPSYEGADKDEDKDEDKDSDETTIGGDVSVDTEEFGPLF